MEFDTKLGLTSDTGPPPEKSQSLVTTSPLSAISQALSSHPFSHTIPALSFVIHPSIIGTLFLIQLLSPHAIQPS